MYNNENIKKYNSNWAHDVAINIEKDGVITNTDVINQSIETILTTPIGSRLFNLEFGSDFMFAIFENSSSSYLDHILQTTIQAIVRWEDRISIRMYEVELVMAEDANMMKLTIPYTIKALNTRGRFEKIITQ